MSTSFKNPPIVEAVFEIRFPGELSIECQKDKYYEKVRKDLPRILLPAIDGPEPYPLKNYRLESSDENTTIMFSVNRFSYHTKQYSDFKTFKKNATEYTKMFCDEYNIKKLKRIGLRYINNIPITRVNGAIQIDKYLKFGFILPDSIPQNHELFQAIILTKFNDGKLRMMVQKQPKKDEKEIILMDFDYFFEGEIQFKDYEEYLNAAHKHTKQIFEEIISDEYKKSLEEEGKNAN